MAKISRWIVTGEHEKLNDHFRILPWGTLQAAVILALAWNVTKAECDRNQGTLYKTKGEAERDRNVSSSSGAAGRATQ